MRKIWMMFFVLSFLFVTLASAVEKVDLREASDLMKRAGEVKINNESSLCALLGLDSQTTLNLISREKDNMDFTHSRYEMLYEGLPVWGHSLVVTESKDRVHIMYGEAILGISKDILSTRAEYDTQKALALAKKHHVEKNRAEWIYESESSRLVVYIDENRARLCYEVTFFCRCQKRWTANRTYVHSGC